MSFYRLSLLLRTGFLGGSASCFLLVLLLLLFGAGLLASALVAWCAFPEAHPFWKGWAVVYAMYCGFCVPVALFIVFAYTRG